MSQLAGVDWKSLFQNIPAAATANAIALAWAPIVGGMPAVIGRGSYYEVVFNPDQEDRAAAWIMSQLDREPGPVRMDLTGVGTKVIMRHYWPHVLGIVALGAAVGYAIGRGSK